MHCVNMVLFLTGKLAQRPNFDADIDDVGEEYFDENEIEHRSQRPPKDLRLCFRSEIEVLEIHPNGNNY